MPNHVEISLNVLFAELPTLTQTLKLVGCKLDAVPDAVRHMSQLRHLDLRADASLGQLGNGQYLEHLHELDLARCDFTR